MSNTVSASHILVSYRGAPSTRAMRSYADAKALVATVEQQISDGTDFAELARQHSDCPSARSGGDLGSFARGRMVPDFDKAVFALDVGSTSKVVETQFGFHLIVRTA